MPSARLFEAILAGMTDVVLAFDRELRCVYANPPAAELHGSDVVGSLWEELFPRRDDVSALLGGGLARVRFIQEHDAHEFEYLVTPVVDEAGIVERIAAVGRDVTEPRRVARSEAAAAARTMRLLAMAASLAAARTAREAGDIALREGLALFGAYSSVLYLKGSNDELVLFAWTGIAESVLASFQRIARDLDVPVAAVTRTGVPAFYETRAAVVTRHAALAPLLLVETNALLALPLVVEGRTIGAISMSFPAERTFDPEERAFAAAIAQQCAQAIERAILADRERANAARAEFLAAASELLSSSLDYTTVLENLARLAVPRIADWCGIEMVSGDTTAQVAVAHVDPKKVSLARELREKYPPNRESPRGVHAVIRSARPELYPEIPDEMLRAGAIDDEHLAIIRSIGMRSAMVVPLVSRERAVGAITLVWAESQRAYGEEDLAFAMEIGRRAALAVDNARLYHELQEAVRIRDDFLGVAGHELRTPFAAMMMQLRSLQRLAEKDEALAKVSDRLAKAANAGGRLDKLIDELLDVSRIVAGRLSIERETVDLVGVMRDVLARYAESAARAGCDLELDAPASIVGEWDPLRIEQVLTNLLGNAIKYGRGQPVTASLREDGESVTVSVRDRGIGIEASQQRRIFERFERAVGTREYGGLGLGLWITREIVIASGGSISVNSEPGQGATFVVRLPKHAAP